MPGAVRLQLPRLRIVLEQRVEDRVELGLERARLDRGDDLDAVVEVARQQVGAAEKVTALLAVLVLKPLRARTGSTRAQRA